MQFIPILNTDAGFCLTSSNWQDVGVKTASLLLETLLLKPGLELLKQLPDLKAYLGWSGPLVLNAKDFLLNKKGLYTITSTFDGSKVSLTPAALVELLMHLKPDAVVLPQHFLKDYPNVWDQWEADVLPYVHHEELQNKTFSSPHGVYFTTSNQITPSTGPLLKKYLCAEPSFDFSSRLEVDFVESNEPANRAMQGTVYSPSGLIDLKERTFEKQFVVIDPHCACPTCTQGLTKAYLHHLLLNTPLLCQRFLIQHNVAVVTYLCT